MRRRKWGENENPRLIFLHPLATFDPSPPSAPQYDMTVQLKLALSLWCRLFGWRGVGGGGGRLGGAHSILCSRHIWLRSEEEWETEQSTEIVATENCENTGW